MSKKEIPVSATNVENGIRIKFNSITEAATALKIEKGNIINCLNVRCKTVRGFRWKKI